MTEQTRRTRSLTTRNLFAVKPGVPLLMADPVLEQAVGAKATRSGSWLVYGPEKHGKTQLALHLARCLSVHERVAYIAAEDGVADGGLQLAVERAGITAADNILWDGYIPFNDILEKFRQPRSASIIIIDNLTVFEGEFPKEDLKMKIDSLPNKLLIFVAHEDGGEPATPVSRMAAKWAKVIFRVKGLAAFVISRYGKGGTIRIDDEKSELIWGL